jgi:hypothetical protein
MAADRETLAQEAVQCKRPIGEEREGVKLSEGRNRQQRRESRGEESER